MTKSPREPADLTETVRSFLWREAKQNPIEYARLVQEWKKSQPL